MDGVVILIQFNIYKALYKSIITVNLNKVYEKYQEERKGSKNKKILFSKDFIVNFFRR